MKEKNSVLITREILEVVCNINNKDAVALLRAIKEYAFGDKNQVVIPKNLEFGWPFVRAVLDLDERRFNAVRQARIEAGKKGAEVKKNKKANKANKANKASNSDRDSNRDSNSDRDSNRDTLSEISFSDADANEQKNISENNSADAERESLIISEIISLYPECRRVNQDNTFLAVKDAIRRETVRHGGDETQALSVIRKGTAAYSMAVDSWSDTDKRYVSDPVRFFNEGKYNSDPAVWDHTSSKKDGGFDPLKPETW